MSVVECTPQDPFESIRRVAAISCPGTARCREPSLNEAVPVERDTNRTSAYVAPISSAESSALFTFDLSRFLESTEFALEGVAAMTMQRRGRGRS